MRDRRTRGWSRRSLRSRGSAAGTLGDTTMHGVPADLPLEPFVGHELTQVCLTRFQIAFHCPRVGSISVEGRWELRDGRGALVDQAEEQPFGQAIGRKPS